MCIRDRVAHATEPVSRPSSVDGDLLRRLLGNTRDPHGEHACLLYTSDAADERSSVDLGGRRIIKKKNKARQIEHGVNR